MITMLQIKINKILINYVLLIFMSMGSLMSQQNEYESFIKKGNNSFEENTVYSVSSLTAGASGSPSGSWDGSFLTYDLDISDIEHTNPVFQVFNDQDKLIFPTNITELTSNEVYQFTFPSYLNLTDFNILVIQGFKSYSETFTTSVDLAPVTIQHELGSNYLFFNLFDIVIDNYLYGNYIFKVKSLLKNRNI